MAPASLARYTAYGASEHTEGTNVEREADVYALFCRLVIEYRGRVKILQPPNVVAMCMTAHILGMLLQSRYHETPLRPLPPDKPVDHRKAFQKSLVSIGVPKDVATQVVRRIRSQTILTEA
jgi:hypothetical protein